jgi:hypothetical protein
MELPGVKQTAFVASGTADMLTTVLEVAYFKQKRVLGGILKLGLRAYGAMR